MHVITLRLKDMLITKVNNLNKAFPTFFSGYLKYMHRPDNYVLCLHIPESVDVEKARKYRPHVPTMPYTRIRIKYYI